MSRACASPSFGRRGSGKRSPLKLFVKCKPVNSLQLQKYQKIKKTDCSRASAVTAYVVTQRLITNLADTHSLDAREHFAAM